MSTFHSDSVSMNKIFYDSHSRLIKDICHELGQSDKVEQLTEKFLTNAFIKIKTPKNPNKPKKALTSYMFFCNDNREAVMKKSNGKAIGDISKILGSMWKEISEKDKKRYEAMHEKDKERYEEEMVEFNKNN